MLPIEVLAQIREIEPSVDQNAVYIPCRVWLRDGTMHERVYLIDAEQYARTWGLVPRRDVLTADVIAQVDEYPERLPVRIANQLYAAGESGMGYCLFELRFRDGNTQAYQTGNAMDFVPYPTGYHAADVVGVRPHAGRQAAQRLEGLSYLWCPVPGLARAALH